MHVSVGGSRQIVDVRVRGANAERAGWAPRRMLAPAPCTAAGGRGLQIRPRSPWPNVQQAVTLHAPPAADRGLQQVGRPTCAGVWEVRAAGIGDEDDAVAV